MLQGCCHAQCPTVDTFGGIFQVKADFIQQAFQELSLADHLIHEVTHYMYGSLANIQFVVCRQIHSLAKLYCA